MYLKCLLCNEHYYLAKYYPSSGWYPQNGEEQFSGLADFLDKHSPCPRRNAEGGYDPNAERRLHGGEDKALRYAPDGEVFVIEYE